MLILLLLFATLGIIVQATSECGWEQAKCANGEKCISLSSVCNGDFACSDKSDEHPRLCATWTFQRDECSIGTFEHFYATYCERCPELVSPRACEVVQQRSLNIVQTGMELSEDNLAQMAAVVNSTHKDTSEECPLLYTRIGDRCLAFFSLAQVAWPEARQFCQTILGDLATFRNAQEYVEMVEYIQESQLTTDFWIGGRYDMDVNSWAWVNDDMPMPLGTPYWAEKYSRTCVPRSPPHTDPFSDRPDALPEAACLNYVQSPKERSSGWCSAMTYKHHYYITDEACQGIARSPLCVLTERHE